MPGVNILRQKMNTEDIVKNFRDVGVSVNRLACEAIFPEGVLYRGGRINSVFSHDELRNIPTIINLRTGKDEEKFNCTYLHVPATLHDTIAKSLIK